MLPVENPPQSEGSSTGTDPRKAAVEAAIARAKARKLEQQAVTGNSRTG